MISQKTPVAIRFVGMCTEWLRVLALSLREHLWSRNVLHVDSLCYHRDIMFRRQDRCNVFQCEHQLSQQHSDRLCHRGAAQLAFSGRRSHCSRFHFVLYEVHMQEDVKQSRGALHQHARCCFAESITWLSKSQFTFGTPIPCDGCAPVSRVIRCGKGAAFLKRRSSRSLSHRYCAGNLWYAASCVTTTTSKRWLYLSGQSQIRTRMR